jgi:hypothetical protein
MAMAERAALGRSGTTAAMAGAVVFSGVVGGSPWLSKRTSP